jgi:uncharacterized membrane protein YvbJ
MNCPECGAYNPSGSEVCSACGASLPREGVIVCEGCGLENAITNRFCRGCGRLLSRPEVKAHREEKVEPSVQERPREGFPTAYLLLILILLVIVLAVLYFRLGR